MAAAVSEREEVDRGAVRGAGASGSKSGGRERETKKPCTNDWLEFPKVLETDLGYPLSPVSLSSRPSLSLSPLLSPATRSPPSASFSGRRLLSPLYDGLLSLLSSLSRLSTTSLASRLSGLSPFSPLVSLRPFSPLSGCLSRLLPLRPLTYHLSSAFLASLSDRLSPAALHAQANMNTHSSRETYRPKNQGQLDKPKSHLHIVAKTPKHFLFL
ncbi:hypothetical protein Syun_028335 [Stephania yunnanensis]|uniref:Uncharacterized protein n=1 Tax=Stephania yunnanensis TaxID=152371 RepID=A0AAP0EHK0_9MAGN